jgi:hypothetical protein
MGTDIGKIDKVLSQYVKGEVTGLEPYLKFALTFGMVTITNEPLYLDI